MASAALNYEPTPDEWKSWVEDMYAATERQGSGGLVTMIPTMERYIWQVEGVYWGHRSVGEDGLVTLAWVRPPDQIAERIEDE